MVLQVLVVLVASAVRPVAQGPRLAPRATVELAVTAATADSAAMVAMALLTPPVELEPLAAWVASAESVVQLATGRPPLEQMGPTVSLAPVAPVAPLDQSVSPVDRLARLSCRPRDEVDGLTPV